MARARPVVRGHYQPQVPADLGFYDLRLAEARAAQAAMAAEYGIDGFCYYHYWFDGRRLLERPFDEVLRSGQPDFPFCLCWANENWTRKWSGRDGEVLVRQTYSDIDDLTHIRWLAEAFSDPRYLRIRGRPVFLVYRAASIPEAVRTTDTWRQESVRLGVGDPYLCLVHSFDSDRLDPRPLGFDAAVKFAPDWRTLHRQLNGSLARRWFRRVFRPRSPYRINTLRDYSSVVTDSLLEPNPDYRLYPCVSPGFDNTPRRPTGATVLVEFVPRRLRDVAPGDRRALRALRAGGEPRLRQRLERVGRGQPPRALSTVGKGLSRGSRSGRRRSPLGVSTAHLDRRRSGHGLAGVVRTN